MKLRGELVLVVLVLAIAFLSGLLAGCGSANDVESSTPKVQKPITPHPIPLVEKPTQVPQ